MKKIMPLFFALVLLAACEKDPDLDKVQNQYVTYTQYDKTADFGSYSTFYVPDSILLITSSPTASYATGADAVAIIKAYASNMVSRGYTQVDEKADADLGLQLSYVESTHYFVDNPYWWNGYPGYWNPNYWGGYYGGGWYYPYPFIYSYTNGALIADLVDLNSTTSDGKLTVIWNDYITGLLSGNSNISVDNTVKAVNQSFTQSPYLKK